MEKRYQIFVSSTFVDLEEERGKVMETILNNDCFPAGMELFPAMDEEQFEYIKKIIDDSDYYLLIIGGRYGSEDSNGVSWTEKEFNYAVQKGIHVMVFDHKDFTQLPANRTDQDDAKRKKLIAFKKKVAIGRLIRKWSNADNLALEVAKSLPKVKEMHPGIGWVRADSIPDDQKDILNKLDELKKEKTKIEKELRVAKKRINILEQNAAKESVFSSVQELTEIFTVKGVTFRMVHVDGGKFKMGANDDDEHAQNNEKPAHDVILSDYWIGETQVTQALWQVVMGENPSYFTQLKGYTNSMNRPVECVNWVKCQEFIEKLEDELRDKLKGRKFHLPTEAQWEFAARGGNKSNGYKFAGRNFNVKKIAWFRDNSEAQTHPVADPEHYPNELGLYDMSGNVWEWCQDCYVEYSNESQNNPLASQKGSNRVFRGGSWQNGAWRCRVSHRDSTAAMNEDVDLGLRLVLY